MIHVMTSCVRPVLNAEMESAFLPVSLASHIRRVMDATPVHVQNREMRKRQHARKKYVAQSALRIRIVKMTATVILPMIAVAYWAAKGPASLESPNAPSPVEFPPVAAMVLWP